MPRTGAHLPLVRHDTDDGGETGHSIKSFTDGAITSEDDIESRMSRRSSVIADLLSLFRRSSSILIRPHTRLGNSGNDDDDDDFDEESDKDASKNRILKKIQQKKEIIQKLRGQPWCMKRKRRTLRVAQKHLQQQEAKVSKVRLYKAEAGRKLTQASRWLDNLKIYLIPWEAKIRKIESHFGSVVSSYFTFHRWVLGVNITITFIMCLFVVIPEWLADSRMEKGSERYNRTKSIKIMPESVRQRADELSTVWDFGGYFQYSLLFYGFYSRETFFGETIKYRVPVAYFLCNIFVLGFSLFIILRKMALNKRRGNLSSGKTQQYLFNWKAFTGWDYTIGNPETAGNVYMANVIKFREAINDDSKKPNEKHPWLRFLGRFFTNIFILVMYAFSIWAIMRCASLNGESFVEQNATAITISLITLVFPNIFDLMGKVEKLHPRNALRFQLGRVLVLYILNYYTLIYSLMFQLNNLENQRKSLETELLASSGVSSVVNPNNRTLRQIIQPLYLINNTHTYFSYNPATTTPSPSIPTYQNAWTTVLPDFGPFGVYNPKAVVTKDETILKTPLVVTHQIGPNSDWNETTTNILNTLMSRTSITRSSWRVMQYQDLCWETIIGQEITKLVTMDLYMTVASIFLIDFLRGLACRYFNFFWPWDLERTFPEYGEFKVAENVLHLVNNQGMIWLGLFFVPLLPMLNNVKLIILMYIRGWAAMTCNVPASQIFRASRSSNFFFALLLLFLFLCTLPVGVVIASRQPSKSCGPFGNQPFFYSVITDVLHENLDARLVDGIKYLLSPGIIIPILVLLLLAIYFLIALVSGLKEANQDLSIQLMFERTEEKKKIFELAGGGKKRKSISVFAKRKTKGLLIPMKTNSSDDDSQSFVKSVPKSLSGRGQFVPSLGSVSEVENSIAEDEQTEESEHNGLSFDRNLTFIQKFFLCFGWKDKSPFQKDIEMEEGFRTEIFNSNISVSDEDEGEVEKRKSEPCFLLQSNPTCPISRDHSEASSKRSSASQKTSNRDFSYRTAIQSVENNSASGSSKSSVATSSLDNKIAQNILNLHEDIFTSGKNNTLEPQDLPIDMLSNKKSHNTVEYCFNSNCNEVFTEFPSQLPQRPASIDDSMFLQQDVFYSTQPHSSYTTAMMSPIMSEFLSTDETTDDEKCRLIPDRPEITLMPKKTRMTEESSRLSGRKEQEWRPARFRISMSPPRKKTTSKKNNFESHTRKYEMRVEKSTNKFKQNAVEHSVSRL